MPENRSADDIARSRSSAWQTKIQGLAEGELLLGLFAIDKKLFAVADNSLHILEMADAIDPERLNPHLGNAQQKILDKGASHPAIYRTLLTAEVLIRPNFVARIDKDQVLSKALEAANDLSFMYDQVDILVRSELYAEKETAERKEIYGSTALPSLSGVETLGRAYIQKADHVLRALFDLVCQFYGRNSVKGYFEGFRERLAAVEKDQEFAEFIGRSLDFIKFVRAARNAVEHPKADQYVSFRNYHMMASGAVSAPTIEVVDPKFPQPAVGMSTLFSSINEAMSVLFEETLVFLFRRNVSRFGNVNIDAVHIPPERRRYGTVRYELTVVNLPDLELQKSGSE